MASQVPAVRAAAYTLFFTLFRNDGTVIANPGTYTKKVSKDGGAIADIAASVTEVDTTYGLCSVVLSIAEMTADAVWVYIKDDTAGCVPFVTTIYTSGQTLNDIDTEVDNTYTRVRDGGDLDNLVDAIKAKTDTIPASPAAVGSAMTLTSAYDAAKTALAASAYTAPDNASVSAIKAKTDNLPSDPADESLLEGVIAALSTKVGMPAAASVSADIAALAAALANLDTAHLDALLAAVAAIKAKTDTLGAAAVTISAPVAESGTITVCAGDSYPVARGRSGIVVSVADATHAKALDDADCTVYLLMAQATWLADAVTETVDGYDVTFTPTTTETAALTARQSYQLRSVWDNADPADDDAETLAEGSLVVVRTLPLPEA